MDPIVGLFSPRLLQGQNGEDAWCSQGSSSHPRPTLLPNPTLSPSIPSIPLPPSPLLHHLSTHLPQWEGGSLKPSCPTPGSIPASPRASHSVFFHKVDEGCAFHLHRLPLPVVHGQYEVEEVGFPEVGGGLLLKMCSCQAYATVGRKGAGKPPTCLPARKTPSPLTRKVGWTGLGSDMSRVWATNQIRWAHSILVRAISVPDRGLLGPRSPQFAPLGTSGTAGGNRGIPARIPPSFSPGPTF